MLTPQEIQEVTFDKAVFGGYDMQTVDEFVEPLIKDYEALYKENAVLKGKLKVLVKKLEEYRNQEESMKQAMVSAQKACSAMVKDAEEKCQAMMAESRSQAAAANVDALVAQEKERLEFAKKAALNFIEVVEQDIKGHLSLLENLKTRDLSQEMPEPQPAPVQKEEPQDIAKAIADEIQGKLSELGLTDEGTEEAPAEEPETASEVSPKPETPAAPADPYITSTIKFTNLQFGKNYDPTAKK